MNLAVYGHILVATLAGGFAGILVMWDRKRCQIAGESKLRRLTVSTFGTMASACALFAFTKALGARSQLYAAVVTMAMTGWTAVLQLPVPRFVLRVRPGEFAFLRSPWTGVRSFGAFLRNTPLRHLGGQVYLSAVGRDPRAVLRGLHAAEAVHIWALLLCCPWFVFWGVQGWWRSLLWGLAIHVPLNVYPILHVRYACWRLEGYVAKTRRSQNA